MTTSNTSKTPMAGPSGSLPSGLALSISRVLDQPSTSANGALRRESPAAPSNDAGAGPSSSSSSTETLTDRLAAQFQSPESVSPMAIHRVQASMRGQLSALDDEIEALMSSLRQGQSSSRLSESGSIHLAVRQLFDQLETISKKATSSEAVVREITGDIKSLDKAKSNLVSSMTAIRRLQMLESGASRLETLTNERNFREAAQALQAAKALQTQFKTFMAVERVSVVWRKINESQQRLKTAAMEEYERFFLHEAGSKPIQSTQLPEAALALDAIGSEAVTALLDWYCGLQLREYRRIFRATDEAGQLDNVARRFAWFRRVMKQHDEENAEGFLDIWQTGKALTGRFADVTREDIKSALVRERARLQVSILLEALGATKEYEVQTAKRFGVAIAEILAANPKPIVAAPTGITIAAQAPADSISSVFTPYLSLYVEAQDKAIGELMANYRRQGVTIPRPGIDQEQGGQMIQGGGAGGDQRVTVLPSSTELFYFYRQTLEQCASLSNREPLHDLCVVFRRYLRIYVDEVLRTALLKQDPSSAIRRPTSTDTRTNVNDLQKWCLILNTADYCANTCQQLEQRLQEKMHPDLRSDVTLDPERDGFLSIVSASIQMLSRETEVSLEPSLTRMMRPATPWSQLEAVHGKSDYIDDINASVEGVAIVVRHDVENKRYVRSWADKVVLVLTTRFINNLVRLRPLSHAACSQLLLDLYEVRSLLVDLPQFSPSELASAIGSSYTRYIDKSIQKIEALLRITMVSETPFEVFIREYVRLISDRSFSNFQKVLDLKGIKKAEMNRLIEQFIHLTSQMDSSSAVSSDDTLVNVNGIGETSFLSSIDLDPSSFALVSGMPTLSSISLPTAQSHPLPYFLSNSSSTDPTTRSPHPSSSMTNTPSMQGGPFTSSSSAFYHSSTATNTGPGTGAGATTTIPISSSSSLYTPNLGFANQGEAAASGAAAAAKVFGTAGGKFAGIFGLGGGGGNKGGA